LAAIGDMTALGLALRAVDPVTVFESDTLPDIVVVAPEVVAGASPPPPPPQAASNNAATIDKKTDKKLLPSFRYRPMTFTPLIEYNNQKLKPDTANTTNTNPLTLEIH